MRHELKNAIETRRDCKFLSTSAIAFDWRCCRCSTTTPFGVPVEPEV